MPRGRGYHREMSSVPPTMNAVLLTGHGGFECLAYRSDVPTPTPGADEVLVRVGAAGVNNTDINMRAGLVLEERDCAARRMRRKAVSPERRRRIPDGPAPASPFLSFRAPMPAGASWARAQASPPRAAESGCWWIPCCARGRPRRARKRCTSARTATVHLRITSAFLRSMRYPIDSRAERCRARLVSLLLYRGRKHAHPRRRS